MGRSLLSIVTLAAVVLTESFIYACSVWCIDRAALQKFKQHTYGAVRDWRRYTSFELWSSRVEKIRAVYESRGSEWQVRE